MLLTLIVLVSTAALAACTSGGAGNAPSPIAAAPARVVQPPPPAPVNPVGEFEFATELNGAPMKGVIDIHGAPGAYTGKVASDVTPELPLTSVSVSGQTMKLIADTPNGAVTMTVTFTGQAFNGSWELAGTGGAITGKRTK